VDDNVGVRNVFHDLLNVLDYESVEATNGCDALEKRAEITPCLIFLDLMMPMMERSTVRSRGASPNKASEARVWRKKIARVREDVYHPSS